MNQTLLNVCGNFPMAAGVQPICARDLPPEIALKGAVLDSLGDVVGGDGFRAAEVGDGAGDVQDAAGCAGGEGEIFHRHAPEVFRVGAQGTEFLGNTAANFQELLLLPNLRKHSVGTRAMSV